MYTHFSRMGAKRHKKLLSEPSAARWNAAKVSVKTIDVDHTTSNARHTRDRTGSQIVGPSMAKSSNRRLQSGCSGFFFKQAKTVFVFQQLNTRGKVIPPPFSGLEYHALQTAGWPGHHISWFIYDAQTVSWRLGDQFEHVQGLGADMVWMCGPNSNEMTSPWEHQGLFWLYLNRQGSRIYSTSRDFNFLLKDKLCLGGIYQHVVG